MQAPSFTYLDWAATTPLCAEARTAMRDFLGDGASMNACEANPNSLHTPGRRAFSALEDARMQVARCIGAGRPTELVFTSGATEADNTAVLGIVSARMRAEKQAGNGSYQAHVVTSAIEHDAVLALAPLLRERGCRVDVLKPDANGFISAEALKAALRPETALVSIMASNNEIGSVQDIGALCAIAHQAGVPFHTDATQALGKIPVDVRAWDVDAASFSAHKIGGPKGIGALYLKSGCKCDALLHGGGQELGKRSGTQNALGAVAFAAACQASNRLLAGESTRLRALRDRLYRELCTLPAVSAAVKCATGDTRFAPNIVNVLVRGFESETLILQLDLAGFAVSGGSACSTGSLEPSHVLTALGIPRDLALGSLRISMGRDTTEDDIHRFLTAFRSIVS